MFSAKTHDLMRKLQLIFAALGGALGIVSAAVDLGRVGIIATAVLSACAYFVGQLAENDSDKFFDTRSIINKVEPDHAPVKEEVDIIDESAPEEPTHDEEAEG